MPDLGSTMASSTSPPPALTTELLEAQLGLVRGMDLCLHYAATDNSHLILHHYNLTGRMANRRPQEDTVGTLKVVFLAAGCLIVMENLLVLLAIARKLQARRWVYSCIASITLSDLLTGVAFMVNLCLSGSRTFRLSPTMWFLREGVLFVALAASTFSLLVTAIERYSTMVKSIAENETSKKARLRGLLFSCWVLAVIVGLLPLSGWNCLCDLPNCSTLLPLYAKNYILFSVVMFIIILVGIVALYASIYRQVSRSNWQATSRCGRKRSLRLLTTVLIILFAFLFCWIPLFILLLMDIFSQTRSWKLHKYLDWALTLAVANSFINPIIYSFRSQEVRRAVLELLCCCCPGECLAVADIPAGSSTESSLKPQESFRNSKALNAKRAREPLSSNSSALSTVPPDDTSDLQQASHIYLPESPEERWDTNVLYKVNWNLDRSGHEERDSPFSLKSY
ncbi:PREDICTED: sphingosine 1-phosphate receptor 4 [Gekko japonicus]|uniref:Sphingosine 1-phosphate receptor 4 n=1 Tax=Gekko japonicus TaxID=146911 RepID=A0ABM1KYL4_GEKJA|nr:PREDICTED: sphingosine 1-phosphate receptor 4 [Gekko japonicus]